MNTQFTLLLLVINTWCYAQNATKISGNVLDDNGEPLLGANVLITGSSLGTTTNADGWFSIDYEGSLPLTLSISMIGMVTKEVQVNSPEVVSVVLSEDILLAQEVVVSASRVEESILESPVSVEKMDLLEIQNTPSLDFYSGLVNKKNVDMSTQSFTFRSLTLRGFNANGNTRMVQLVDGMDNQAPGLNFPVGNIVGTSELDLESVELLPGAASALYGPNAINGIILMNSKNPFDYQGLSAIAKTGINHINDQAQDASPFLETSIRYAKAFKNKLAFKINASVLDAEDWRASDFRDRSLDPAITRESPSYEAINIYGDETSTFLPLGENGEDLLVTRTGYTEEELVDYTARSVKLSGALHYRFTKDLEAIFQANYGTGQTVYTGIDRYALQDFSLSQYKLELKGEKLSLRAYTTRENSGDSYAIGTLGLAMNEQLKVSESWFEEYAAAYGGAIADVAPLNHQAARDFADRDLALPGSSIFEETRESIINTPLSEGGAKFLDKSNLWAFEGMYDFTDQIRFVDLIIGANYRIYDLNSEGTLFALDENGDEYSISEFGGFAQASKRFFNDKLKITGSLRYDKNENFEGRTTPRVSGVLEFLNNQYLRTSFQTGFRMPTTQNQYIDLLTPQARLIGGLPLFRDRYEFDTNPVYGEAAYFEYVETFLGAQGQALAEGQSQEQALVTATGAAGPVLEGAEILDTSFELEQNRTFEIGYKGLIDHRAMIDAYYYHSTFNNFSGALNLFQSSTDPFDPSGLLSPAVYQTTVSLDQEVKSQGISAGISYMLTRQWRLGTNYSWNEIIDEEQLPDGFQTGFNTPENKVNVTLSNRKLTKNLGFNIAWRWQDDFIWESTFAQGVVPAYNTLDIQFSYLLPKLKSRVKLGGSNILNDRYEQALGNPTVGSLYYLSISFDEMIKNR